MADSEAKPAPPMEIKDEEVAKEKESDKDMDKQTLLAVLQFLKKHNLQETEGLLRKEAKLSESVKAEETVQSESEVSQALAAYKSEGDPTVYFDYYVSLKGFVEASLDVHKCELATVLYPVFVHMYLELVYNNHEDLARMFFSKFSLDQDEYREEDLRQLSTVTTASHMKGNQLLDNFKSSKFVIRMSRDSYNHLKRHLQEKKQKMLLNIVQEHLFIDVFDGVPRNKQQIDAAAGGMTGEAKREANKSKVFYGLPKEPEINIPLDEDEEQPEGEEKPKKKKPKKDPLLTKKSKNDPNAPPANRIPMPELKEADKLEKVRAYREMTKRLALSADQRPSICFYTFLNAFQGASCVELSEDCSLMSAGFGDSQIRVWSLSPNRLRGLKSGDDLELIDKEADDVLERMMDDRTAADSKQFLGHAGPVYSTSFSLDKNFLLSSSEDGTVRLWSLLTWTNLVCYKGHNYPVWDATFSSVGHYFASCGYDRTARLWCTDHYQPVRIFTGHLADVDKVQFHPNSNYIATGSTDRTVRLWDVLNGNCVRIMTGHKGPITSLRFSPCGRYLASGGADRLVHVWDIASGEAITSLKCHTNTVYSLAFSRDGTILATGGVDNLVNLWDITKVYDDSDQDLTLPQPENQYSLGSYPTKNSPVLALNFTRRNLLLGAGPYYQTPTAISTTTTTT